MKPVKYIFWMVFSLALILLVNASARSSKPRLNQVDLEFDELAIC